MERGRAAARGAPARLRSARDAARLPRTFRFLTRGLGTQQTRSNDMISLVMFQHDYLERLLELGEQDAAERAGEIEQFVGE